MRAAYRVRRGTVERVSNIARPFLELEETAPPFHLVIVIEAADWHIPKPSL